MSAEEIELRLPHLTLRGLAWGPENGSPCLALHGWLDNAASYLHLAPRLVDALGLRLVAVDLAGHGLSDRRAPGDAYHFVDWIPEVFEMADALGWERFDLMGHSMGAAITGLAAGVYPERVARAVFIEGIGPMTDPEDAIPDKVASYVRERARVLRREPLPHESRDVAAERLAKVVPNLSVANARILVERGTEEVEGGVIWRSDGRLRQTSPHRLTEGQVHAFFRRISAPVLVVWAEDGWTFAEDIIDRRSRCISRLEVVRMPGGHHVHMEAPGPVATAITGFLGRHPGPT